jgi:hypothetical protein
MEMRRLAAVLAGLNVFLMGAVFVQSERAVAVKPSDILRARAIALVDERDQVRAQLDVEEDGEVVFRLRDAKGGVRVKLGAGRDGSGFILMDGATEPAIQMLAKEGATSLTLRSGGTERRPTPQ